MSRARFSIVRRGAPLVTAENKPGHVTFCPRRGHAILRHT